MAEPVSAQERLDKIVVLIAANMVAEVCSVYVLRVDGTLELYATEGLKREAVHQTVLRQDEGLVGLVASEANPVNLSDAQNHPAFSYRPETGEEIYHSFLACRCCAAAIRSAFWWCRTARGAPIPRRKRRRCRPPPWCLPR
jgi:phosphotransferase system enzyme I (PtsP)